MTQKASKKSKILSIRPNIGVRQGKLSERHRQINLPTPWGQAKYKKSPQGGACGLWSFVLVLL
jgi:hypothetical protein